MSNSLIPRDEDLRRRWLERRAEIETKLAEKKGARLLVDSYTYLPLTLALNFPRCKKGYQYIEAYRDFGFRNLKDYFMDFAAVEVETGIVGVIDAVIVSDVANGAIVFKEGMTPARSMENLLVHCLGHISPEYAVKLIDHPMIRTHEGYRAILLKGFTEEEDSAPQQAHSRTF